MTLDDYCTGGSGDVGDLRPLYVRKGAAYQAALAQKAAKPKPHLETTEIRHMALPAIEYGANKYCPWGWLDTPMAWTDLLDATQRHLDAWGEGQDADPESGVCHLHHVAANVGFLLTYLNRGMGNDDRRIA